MNAKTLFLSALAVSALASPAAAYDLPEGVRAMIEAAIESGDPAKVAVVIDLARQTYPGEAAEIDRIESAFKSDQAEAAAAQAAAERAEIENAGLFDRWSGKGQVGAFRATGNSEDIGLTGTLNLERTGIDWTHILRARADYQESRGTVTRERYLLAYEPRLQVSEDLFVYGLAQGERDRLQGYDIRVIASGGVGWNPIDRDGLSLALKAGPAYRYTDFVSEPDRTRLAGLAAVDFDWEVLGSVTVTQDASAVYGSDNTTLVSLTGVELSVTENFSTRISYQVDYESDPPIGAVSTDTLTRFTLVYGF